MASQQEKVEAFKALHETDSGFIIPNPWDAGSARMLTNLGYKALATTSSGFAHSIGCADGQVSLVQKIAHCRVLVAATELPISADLENCFSDDPEMASKTISLVAGAGIVGGSIEDWKPGPDGRIYDFDHAVERVAAAVEAARAVPYGFTLTARAENLLHGRQDLDDTIRRLQAFEAVGADVLFAPGLTTLDEVRTVVGAVGKPVNVLGMMIKDVSVADLIEAGAKRISVGSAFANATFVTFMNAARELHEGGNFNWMADGVAAKEAQKLITG